MKKLVLAVVAVAALALAIGNANAEEKYVVGGFEANGHVNTAIAFNYIGKNGGAASTAGSTGFTRDGWQGFRNGGNYYKQFGFLLDEVQLNLMKTFGENIRARADIAFGDPNIGSPWNGVYLKQAYATANIAAGNGIELLVGRFAAPMGYESIDRNDNNTITRSAIFNYNIRPRTLTGLKFYYAFSDAFDWHVWFANNMSDGIQAWQVDVKVMPAIGTRIGYTWGDEGTESTVGLSGAISPDVDSGSKLGRMSFLADLDFNIYATDSFVIGGEGIYRQNDKPKLTPGKSTKIFGGILDLNYAFSDVWDGTIKYSLLKLNQGLGSADANDFWTIGNGAVTALNTANNGWLNEISLAGGYQITDGAKFKAEFRLDWTKMSKQSKNLSYDLIGMFEYAF